jgi:hypothetical protein
MSALQRHLASGAGAGANARDAVRLREKRALAQPCFAWPCFARLLPARPTRRGARAAAPPRLF